MKDTNKAIAIKVIAGVLIGLLLVSAVAIPLSFML